MVNDICWLCQGKLTASIFVYCFCLLTTTGLALSSLSGWGKKFVGWCHVCCWWHFLTNGMGSKHCKTEGRSVLTTRATMLENKPFLVAIPWDYLGKPMNFFSNLSVCCSLIWRDMRLNLTNIRWNIENLKAKYQVKGSNWINNIIKMSF